MTIFSTGLSTLTDSFLAGKNAAEKAYQKLNNQKPHLIILFSSSKYDSIEVLKGIKEVVGSVPIFGCTSSGEFTEDNVVKKGVVCALISSENYQFKVGIGEGIQQSPQTAVEKALNDFSFQSLSHPHMASMVLMDGLIPRVEDIIEIIQKNLGANSPMAGGLAGDNLEFKKSLIFSENEALSNAFSLCLIHSKRPIIVSVKHGHIPISETLMVTKSKGNVIYEINHHKAVDVWKSIIKNKASEIGIDVDVLSQDEISNLLLRHEFGLITSSDYIIRYPMLVNKDGSINFNCNFPENTLVKIMDSKPKDQILSARAAAEQAIQEANGVKIAGAIVYDCICRSMILESQFRFAIEEIKKTIGKEVPLIGFETYGEIAINQSPLSGFHNSTTVVVLFPA